MTRIQRDDDHQAVSDTDKIFLAKFRRNRVFVLLAALFLKILISALIEPGGTVATLLQGAVVVAGIITVSDTRRHLVVGLLLGVPALIMLGIGVETETRVTDWIGYFMAVLFYLYIVRLILVKIFNNPVVTIDTIGLAICCYVLLGQVWMLFYAPVIQLDPHAFSVPMIPQEDEVWRTLTYFSYVTLTTLGYGDISPVSPPARALAILEALTGTLFLAVLISRLVGTYRSGPQRKFLQELKNRDRD